MPTPLQRLLPARPPGNVTQLRPFPAHVCAQVKKRGNGSVLQAVRALPGHAQFPAVLASAVVERINTWFQPIYGFNEEEELGVLSPDALHGARSAYAWGLLPGWSRL